MILRSFDSALHEHPRLWAGPEQLAGLKRGKTGAFPGAWAEVAKQARQFMRDPEIVADPKGHNWHLVRARKTQQRMITLCVWHLATGDKRARRVILEDVARMAAWKHWCWQDWRGEKYNEAYYDLSSGENATTLALAFDWLYPQLSGAEKDLFVRLAEARVFKPYVRICSRKEGKRPWFYEAPHSNWNTVCNGGAGMLALAMAGHSPLAQAALALAEKGVAKFFKGIGADGGWPEGIAYWNYGMRYGFMYLMSWERAFGRTHPLMRLPATRATLRFPLLFSPGGLACSFGDCNSFEPLPFHVAAARRLGETQVAGELLRRMNEKLPEAGTWPSLAELLLLPQERPTAKSKTWPSSAVLKNLGWAYLCDRWPDPAFYASAKGGDTGLPHSHQDLLSFFIAVKGERLIEGVSCNDYHDATFGPRRFEIYEMSAASKNTLFVNGIGPNQPGKAAIAQVKSRGAEGVFLDVTEAMREKRDGDKAIFCGRMILMLKKKALLVLDRVVLPNAGFVEARYHTYAHLKMAQEGALITQKAARLHASFASTVPHLLSQSTGAPTMLALPHEPYMNLYAPGKKTPTDKIIRHGTQAKEKQVTLAGLFCPGKSGSVRLKEKDGRLDVRVSGSFSCTLSFALKNLKLIR